MLEQLKYRELKSGFGLNGPAWVGLVKLSRTGTTIYFNGKAFKKAGGRGIAGNYYDIETGEEYWISGIKKNGRDRLFDSTGPAKIDKDAVSSYLRVTGKTALPRNFTIFEAEPSLPEKFYRFQNEKSTK